MSFQGDTMSCLKHLYGAIKDDDNFFGSREIIAHFTGTSEQSVYRWFSDKNEPKGEPLIKLRYYLEFNDYEVAELSSLDPILKQAGKLLAFGIVSLDEMVDSAGYSAGPNSNSTILRILRAAQGVPKDRLSQFQALVELHQEQLTEKMQNTPRVVSGRLDKPLQPKPLPVRTPLRVVARPLPAEHDAIISSLAGMVNTMLPLARLVSSDSFTPEDRAKVRELSLNEGVFDLANALFGICGERSRQMRQQ